MIRTCKRHGKTEHFQRKDGRCKNAWRCGKCSSDAVVKRRRKVKAILVAEHGGKCSRCPYDKSLAALQFHHRDPSGKDHTLRFSNTASLDRLRAEAAKCDLLCANCHAEVEEELRS